MELFYFKKNLKYVMRTIYITSIIYITSEYSGLIMIFDWILDSDSCIIKD